MTEPLSSAVSAGQPTAAAHYNTLRLDALYGGFDPADAVPLATLLAGYSHNLNLSLLGSNRLRVVASPGEAVAVVIDGGFCRASANVDLPAASAPSGAAAAWYVFAQRNAGSTGFTLAANTSPTPAAGQRLLGSCWWDGSAIAADSIVLARRADLLRALNFTPASLCGGRLCLQSGEPLPTTDRAGGTVYYTPFNSDVLQTYAPGAGWRSHLLTELSLGLPATANTNYDLFAHWNGSALALTAQAWSSDTVRAAPLAALDGRWVLASDPLQLYLGSVRVGASGMAVDAEKNRFVWNAFNACPRLFYQVDSTTHTYAAAAWRSWNDDSNNFVNLLLGIKSPLQVSLFGDQSGSVAGDPARVGIGVDSIGGNVVLGSSSGVNFKGTVQYNNLAGPGLVKLNICEYSHPTSTGTYNKAILSGVVWC